VDGATRLETRSSCGQVADRLRTHPDRETVHADPDGEPNLSIELANRNTLVVTTILGRGRRKSCHVAERARSDGGFAGVLAARTRCRRGTSRALERPLDQRGRGLFRIFPYVRRHGFIVSSTDVLALFKRRQASSGAVAELRACRVLTVRSSQRDASLPRSLLDAVSRPSTKRWMCW